MAWHNSTPISVLEAPKPSNFAMVTHEGASRRERRHGLIGSYTPIERLMLLRTRNTTFVRGTTRRGKKVRRHRA